MFSGKEYKCDSQTDNRKTDKQKITIALLYTALWNHKIKKKPSIYKNCLSFKKQKKT